MGKFKNLLISIRNEYLDTMPQERHEILEAVIEQRFQEWTKGNLTPENAPVREWEQLGKPKKQ
tara:strand:+ start:1318 stop:1506 length:189 start_codon:yes stop_codon:yes gene_type:complete